MKALVIHAPGDLRIEDVPTPPVAAGPVSYTHLTLPTTPYV